MLYIDENEVTKLLNWHDVFEATRAAMLKVSKSQVVQDARSFTKVLGKENVLLTMPGYVADTNFGALACKLVTCASNNEKLEKPLPTINANILLFDEDTGILKAVIAATELTKWRTAAASAVATKFICESNKSKTYDVLAILGCGKQGGIHGEAFSHFFNFKEIRLWDRKPEKAKHLADDLNRKLGTKSFKWVDSNELCVKDADVIVTATFASSPIVLSNWVKPGAHINAIGAGPNHHSELDEVLYHESDVYIDHEAGAKNELAGLIAQGVKFRGEIGSLLAGELSVGDPCKVTVFQSLGMAAEDCTMARLIYDLYLKK